MRGTKLLAIPRAGGDKGLRLQALPLLAMLLLAAVSPVSNAEEPVDAATPLQELIRAGDAKSVRFVLTSGKTVIGRIVRVDDTGLLIRRPSAGLLSLPLADIAGVKIKAPDGEFLLGKVMRMTDGGIGWLAESGGSPDSEIASADADRQSDTGGPLIRLDRAIDDPNGASLEERIEGEDGEAEAIDVKLTDVAPADDLAPERASVKLTVTADETSESDKLMYFRLTLSEPASQSILVIYTMIDGSAVAPGDYTHRQGVVVFEPGETAAAIATSIINDETTEGEESFTFFVTADPAAVTIDNRKIDATIADDDG